jgi:hypothetical protein
MTTHDALKPIRSAWHRRYGTGADLYVLEGGGCSSCNGSGECP